MLAYNELPVIVVSAVDTATAASFISELIDDEVKDVEVENEDTADRVWRMNNKYYTAEVRLRPLGDGCEGAGAGGRVDAHVVHLAAGEGEREARRRWAAVGGAPAVGVAAGEWARASPALARWAAAQRVDAVPLLERPSPDAPVAPDAPFAEAYGVQRVRDALHAHAWRGLRRHRHRPRAHAHAQAGDCVVRVEAGVGEGEGDGEEEEAGAVERAEAFALALGALGGARDSPADDAQRRARAEQLVAAFARALGLDADEC
ncbi:hypothetical protein K1T71_002225 [Dendrolimus kikuchii]|uniref:Uncharacterized protein n=1 Tax=Dendrolimus kikuchii TaxID=765133 RepID=A0ACC1DG64_9NEOP|nr:hypothetical protein K1T71_002225 [Dendrolimus kikuchii]